MAEPAPPPPAIRAPSPRFPVDSAFDTALFTMIAVALILGVPLAGAGYGVDLSDLPGSARMVELGYVLTFAIALPGMLVYATTQGAWVVDPPRPGPGGDSGFGLRWERRFGPLVVSGTRVPASTIVAVAAGGLVELVTRNGKSERQWSYQAFVATRDGRLLPAGPEHRGAPGAADEDARALARALGLTARTAVPQRGLELVPGSRGSYEVATRAEGTGTGWSTILAVLATLFGMVGFMAWFATR